MARIITAILTILGVGVGSLGADVAQFNPRVTPDFQVEIKGETVDVRQIGDEVRTNLPWKGEQGITLKYDMGEASPRERLRDKRDIEILTETVDGGFKVDFLLNERPGTNVFCQTVEGGDQYNWFYQPELTQQEIDEGAERPDNVVGSYAVYHKTLRNHKLGETNYETGKAFHVYRPQVWEVNDKDNTTQWVELNYDNGNLCVTVPQDYLDNATYPVRVDPTFGLTTIGASTASVLDDYPNTVYSSTTPDTFPENGTLDSMTRYTEADTGVNSWMMGLFDMSGFPDVTSIGNTEEGLDFAGGWVTLNAVGTVTLVSGTEYGLVMYDEAGSFSTQYYDDVSTYSLWRGNTDTYDGTFPSSYTLNVSQGASRRFSIYATYTAAPAETTVSTQTTISGDIIIGNDLIVR